MNAHENKWKKCAAEANTMLTTKAGPNKKKIPTSLCEGFVSGRIISMNTANMRSLT